MKRSIAVIGSFKQYNAQIQILCAKFRGAGLFVTSPQGTEVIEQGINFVRFHSDRAESSDAAVQSLALHRILRSDLVYVFVPEGYIGKTTCYEVGRVLQSGIPIYFSQQPLDLPVHVPESFVMNAEILLSRLGDPAWHPEWLYATHDDEVGQLERQLRAGVLRND